jgi:hypothetical protein
MGPNFKDPVLVDADTLKVEGSFDTHGEVIGDVTIGFLIIPKQMDDALIAPISDIVVLPHIDLDKSAPDPAKPGVEITHGDFQKADVSNDQYHLGVGHEVRVIGLAVSVKAGGTPDGAARRDAPAFETFTWCVDRKVVAP